MYKYTKKEIEEKKSLFLYSSPDLAPSPIHISTCVHSTIIVIQTQTNTCKGKLSK